MNRIVSTLVCGAVFLVTSAFAVEWQKESAPFEFPTSSVKRIKSVSRHCFLSSAKLCGKNQVVFSYALPSNVTANLEIYSINGMRLAAIPITNRTTSVSWKSNTKHASGIYTAVLKTADVQKSLRFVIAN